MTIPMTCPQGVHTAIITPFRENKSVDFEGLQQNVKIQLQNQVDGLVILGTTGETPTLSIDEKKEIITTVVSQAKGRTFLTVGTGTNCTQTTIENTLQAKELGADAALLVVPYYNKPNQQGLLNHFTAIASATDLPLIVYNVPGRSSCSLCLETVKRLSDIPEIIGIKEASGNMDFLMDIVIATKKRRKDFLVFSGDDSLTFPLLACGGDGVISVTSNVAPTRMKHLCETALNGDLLAARSTHQDLLPLMRTLFMETNPQPTKCAMELIGCAGGGCRLPLVDASPETRTKLHEVLSQLEMLPSELKTAQGM